jgi:hypothetical protein
VARAAQDHQPPVPAGPQEPALLGAEVVEAAVDDPHGSAHPGEVLQRSRPADLPQHVVHDVQREPAGADVDGGLGGQRQVHHELVEAGAGVRQASDGLGEQRPPADGGAQRPRRAPGSDEAGDLLRVPGRVRDGHVAAEGQAHDERPPAQVVHRARQRVDGTVQREPLTTVGAVPGEVDRDRPVAGSGERLDLGAPHRPGRAHPVRQDDGHRLHGGDPM